MSGPEIGIGELARATGCKVQTIRYYEEIGLMPEPARTAGNQRRYDQRHVERLAFIRQSREPGFSLEAIRELLSLSDRADQPCDAADRLARRQLEQVERRLARLSVFKPELERMIEQCAGGRICDCRIIEALSNRCSNLAGGPHAAPRSSDPAPHRNEYASCPASTARACAAPMRIRHHAAMNPVGKVAIGTGFQPRPP